MRFPLAFLSIAALVLALPAAAQDPDAEPGCVEANPCEIIVAVDAEGFADISETEFTQGDWLVATVVNHDEEADHTVRLSDHALEIVVPAGDVEDSEPFRIGEPGRYPMTDAPSNDVLDITVVEADEFEDSSGDEDRGSPGLGLAALVGALAALVIVARRKA